MNIVLIGYRCAGKTSVGRLLAKVLGMKFVDLDEVVEQASGCSIDEIVSRSGWSRFRALEQEAIKHTSRKDNLVIATGGGVVLQRENVEQLEANGLIIWLRASAEMIKERMVRDDREAIKRPPLSGKDSIEEIHRVLAERERHYQRAADLIIDTNGMDIKQVVDTTVVYLESLGQKKGNNVRK